MRSSTRKADRVRMPLLVLAFTMAACTSAAGAVSDSIADHSRDLGENHRAAVFAVADHSRDAVEAQRDHALTK